MSTTRQSISIGSAANDGTGDTLRSAGTKINSNFGTLYNFLGGDSDNLPTRISLNDSAVVFTNGVFDTVLRHSGASSRREVTIPNATGVITLNEATQTLTNKSIEIDDIILNDEPISGAGTIDNADKPYVIFSGTTYTVTLADAGAGETGKLRVFTNGASGTINVTVTSGSNFSIASGGSKMCIWNGSNWIQLT